MCGTISVNPDQDSLLTEEVYKNLGQQVSTKHKLIFSFCFVPVFQSLKSPTLPKLQNFAYCLIKTQDIHIMTFKSLGSLALFGALLRCTFAQSQQSNIVPEDLRNGFRGGSVEVQVSYVNRAIDGFRDGTQFEKDGQFFRRVLRCVDLTHFSRITRTYLCIGGLFWHFAHHPIHNNNGRYDMPK